MSWYLRHVSRIKSGICTSNRHRLHAAFHKVGASDHNAVSITESSWQVTSMDVPAGPAGLAQRLVVGLVVPGLLCPEDGR
jgi:hypothetical protein